MSHAAESSFLSAGIVPQPATKIWLRGGRVVRPEGVIVADVSIVDGKIAAIHDHPESESAVASAAAEASADGGVVVDVRGKYLLPGALDMHVHFRDPLPQNPAEDLRSGSLAAAAGGVVGFADMPNTDPPVTSAEALTAKLALAAEKSAVDYSFFVAIPSHGDWREQLGRIAPETIPGLKIYIGGTTRAEALDDAQLDAAFALAAQMQVPAVVHAEDDATIARNLAAYSAELADPAVHARIRDAECCLIATEKAIGLARKHGAHLHVAHLSTAVEAELIADTHRRGDVRVTAEVTLHHLMFCTADYARLGHFLKCNPSVKTAEDRAALWEHLRAGTIHFIATDHAPHPLASKTLPYAEAPSGVAGVEMVLPVLLDEVNAGRVSLPEIAQWTAQTPARIYGITGKGRIEVGNDADIVVVDLDRVREVSPIKSACGHSPWQGRSLKGWPVLTLLRGRPVFADATTPPFAPGRPLHFDHGFTRG